MSDRLVRLAKAIAVIEVKKAPDGMWREDELLDYGRAEGVLPDKGKKDGLDLKAEDLANRLEEAVAAIGDCVAILESLGMEAGKAEEKILSLVQDEVRGSEEIPGGLAKGKPDSDFDSAQIEKGIKVELEHTGDKDKAREIAKDHLMENPKYYDYLEEMEEKADKESGKEQDAADFGEMAAGHIEKAIKGLGDAERHVGQAMMTLPDADTHRKVRLDRIRRDWGEQILDLGDMYRNLVGDEEE